MTSPPTPPRSAAAVKEAGDKTIAAGIDEKSRFFTLAKAAGSMPPWPDRALYRVRRRRRGLRQIAGRHGRDLDEAEAVRELTRTLSYQILPGTVLVEDIGKAIDAGDGKAQLATMGGGALTASREGDKIVLTDGAGGKATIAKGDENLANGVIHRVDAVLMPSAAT